MLKSRALIVIIALLAFAPALVGCPTNGGGNQNGPDTIAAGDTAFDNGQISFDVPGGLLTYRQIEELRNMDVSQFEGYVTSVTVAADGAVTIAVTNGEEATATITIPADQVDELGDVLEEAQSRVIETRDAAGNQPVLAIEREHPTSGYTIRFYVDPSLSSPELIDEISTIVTNFGTLAFNPRVQWISSWTLVPEGDSRLYLNSNPGFGGGLGFEQDGAGRVRIFSYSISSVGIGNIGSHLLAGQQWAQAQAALGTSAGGAGGATVTDAMI